MWEYRERLLAPDGPENQSQIARQFSLLLAKLERSGPLEPANCVPAPAISRIDFDLHSRRLLEIRDLKPQDRGYQFEKFLCGLFDAFELKVREPFRIVGEQIDGSFELASEIYLIEAKWLNRKVGAAELYTFQGKLYQKASWARGLFISFGGFTDEGLVAFGRGKRVIGLEGRDLHQALSKGIGLDRVIAAKARNAAETGEVFTPIEKLFPTSR